MPHLDIRLSMPANAEKTGDLAAKIGAVMETIPGKTISNTVISISGGYSMYKDGRPLSGAFVDVRLYKASPEESKKDFSGKIFSIMESVLGIPPENVQMNFIELPSWASGGDYR